MTADETLKKAFADMHVAMIESNKKLRMLELQTEALKISKQRLEITEKEISKLPEETKVYESVGRMFSLATVKEMSGELKNRQQKVDQLVSQCDNNKDYLVKSLKEQETNLRELVQQKRDAAPEK